MSDPGALHAALARLAAHHDATLGTRAHNTGGMPDRWDEDTMLRILWRHFTAQSWAAVPQVTVAARDLTPDYLRLATPEAPEDARDRRIDLLAARVPTDPRHGLLETLAVEVKVTRADYLTDIRTPAKQAGWRQAATRHTYAVPAGLISPDEVPEGSGLLVVRRGPGGWGEVDWARRAPYRPEHAPDLPQRAVIALLHRIAALEGHTRGWHAGPHSAGTPQELRAALTAAHKATDRALRRAERAEDKATAWQAAYGHTHPDGHPCHWCGRPTKPINPTAGWFRRWRHLDTRDDTPCLLVETALAEQQARDDYDTATPQTRAAHVAGAHLRHRDRFDPSIEAAPWRAFLPPATDGGAWHPTGPRPAETAPENPARD